MTKRRLVWIGMMLCMCFLLLPCAVSAISTADAAEPVSLTTDCSLTAVYSYENTAFSGIGVNVYRIADVRLVMYIAKKFESNKIDMQDLVSVGSIGLIKAVDSYKLDKNIKLATYASRCIENEILMFLRKANKSINDLSLDDLF